MGRGPASGSQPEGVFRRVRESLVWNRGNASVLSTSSPSRPLHDSTLPSAHSAFLSTVHLANTHPSDLLRLIHGGAFLKAPSHNADRSLPWSPVHLAPLSPFQRSPPELCGWFTCGVPYNLGGSLQSKGDPGHLSCSPLHLSPLFFFFLSPLFIPGLASPGQGAF